MNTLTQLLQDKDSQISQVVQDLELELKKKQEQVSFFLFFKYLFYSTYVKYLHEFSYTWFSHDFRLWKMTFYVSFSILILSFYCIIDSS